MVVDHVLETPMNPISAIHRAVHGIVSGLNGLNGPSAPRFVVVVKSSAFGILPFPGRTEEVLAKVLPKRKLIVT